MDIRDRASTSPDDTDTVKTPSAAHPVRAFVLAHLPWLVILSVLVVLASIYGLSGSFSTLVDEAWAVAASGDQQRIRDYLKEWGAWGPVASVLLMLLQGIFAPIPASLIQLANGVVFGVFWGAVLNLIGQMAGATVAFFIARFLGRNAAERLVGRFDKQAYVEEWLKHWGAKALFLIRAIPGMPSDFVSYLLGLSRMPARTYFTVSFIGYIPQSFAYSWLGDYATRWFWWIVLAGFGVSFVIGGIVWLVRKITMRTPAPRRAIAAKTGTDC